MSENQTILGIKFNEYATNLHGHMLGDKRQDQETRKEWILCKTHTTLLSTALVVGRPVVLVGATGVMTATDDVSEGLQTSYPIPLGFPGAAAPASTATVTYYFWAQTWGPVHTDPTALPGVGTLYPVPTNGDDDIAAGDTIIKAGDGVVNSVAAGSAVPTMSQLGFALADDVNADNTVTVFADVAGMR